MNNPFRIYLKRAKERRKLSPDLTSDYLQQLWKSQKGKCNISGIKIKLIGSHTSIFDLASLDRIESKKGYEPGNLQFISGALNFAKNNEDNKKFIRFLKNVSKSILKD